MQLASLAGVNWPALPSPPWTTGKGAAPAFATAAHCGKVPPVTLGFWIIKIAATTLGETGGDAVSMTLRLGYALSSILFLTVLIATVATQVRQRRFHPFLYWAVIVATTTAGTTMADFCDRSLGIGYIGGSLLLTAGLAVVLAAWFRSVGTISVANIVSARVELFYWAAILASNTLGTALGDFLADSGFGYEGGAMVFSAALAAVAIAWFARLLSPTPLFWAAFILTRPLGATLGDLLTKPVAGGGIGLGRFLASSALAVFIIGSILLSANRSAPREP